MRWSAVRRKENAHQPRRVLTTCAYWSSLKRYLLHKARAFALVCNLIWSVAALAKTWTAKRKIYNRQRKTLKVGFLLHVIAVKSIAAFLINLYVIFLLLAYENRRRSSSFQLRRSLLMNLFCFRSKIPVNRRTFSV